MNFMFIVFDKDCCPSCGTTGKNVKKKPDMFSCPKCNTIFNEFGIISQMNIEEDEMI